MTQPSRLQEHRAQRSRRTGRILLATTPLCALAALAAFALGAVAAGLTATAAGAVAWIVAGRCARRGRLSDSRPDLGR